MLRPTLIASLLFSLAFVAGVHADERGAGASPAAAPPAIAPPAFADPFDTAASIPPVRCVPPTPADALDLAGVIDQALCNNPQTREAWAAARAQAGLVGVARAAWLPNLSASVGSNRVRTAGDERETTRATVNSAGLSFSWLLYDFGVREATLESARQLLAAAIATQDSTTQAVFLAALQAFYQNHALQAALDAAELSEKAARESLAAADARYRAGSATPADRLQAQTALSQATLTRIRVGGELKNAQGALANSMGLDAHRPLRLAPLAATTPPGDFERNVDSLIDEARRRRPDLAAAEAQAQAADATVDATRAAHLPTITLGAQPTWQNNAGLGSDSQSIGLTVNIPLFSGFGQTYKVRTAEAQAEQRAAQRDRLRLQVALDVWRSYQNLLTATQSLRSTADLLASAEQSERVALGRYRAGVGSILDLLTAQSALASARQQRVQSTYDWNVSRATLAQSVGILDAGLLPALTGTLPSLPAANGKP
ncbi:MAG TPA: TolC family protein [Azospira sp.]|nr:TolC family protein [Azospira sp.]